MISTALTELTGAAHPVIQGPLGFVGGTELPLACSRAGALGMIAGATVTPERMRALTRRMREATDAPFGVNIRGDAPDLAERLAVLVAERVRVVSFARAPGRTAVSAVKDAGAVTLASVGSRRHAERAAADGVDILVVQGAEGGAHVGVVPTALLLADVRRCVDLPVVAAGGFRNAAGLVSALAQGACGIVLGTRFLMTADAPLADEIKAAYVDAALGSTVVTSQVDGAPLRVLRSRLVESLPDHPRPEDAVRLLSAALLEGDPDAGVLAAGEVVGLIDDLPTCEALIKTMISEAAAVVGRLAQSLRPTPASIQAMCAGSSITDPSDRHSGV